MKTVYRELIDQTLALCEISSVTGDEAKVADYVEQVCRQLVGTSRTKRVGHVVIADGPSQSDKPLVTLLGHLDTVPSAPVQTWAVDEQAGRIFGLGASDMKAGVSLMLQLLKEADALSSVNIRCVFYDREEGSVQQNGLEPILQAGYLQGTDLAICLEPTDGEVQLGCVGSIQATVTFQGIRAHSARPWQGRNAIYQAIPFLKRLEQFGKKEVMVSGLPFYEVMHATTASAGIARNVIPDRFVLNVNYRYAPGKSPEEAISEIHRLVNDEGTVVVVDVAPSGAICLDHPLLQSWIERRGLRFTPKQAWTDVARLTSYGFAAVNFGPGETAQAHQANESVAIHMLTTAYEDIRDLLMNGQASLDSPRLVSATLAV